MLSRCTKPLVQSLSEKTVTECSFLLFFLFEDVLNAVIAKSLVVIFLQVFYGTASKAYGFGVKVTVGNPRRKVR